MTEPKASGSRTTAGRRKQILWAGAAGAVVAIGFVGWLGYTAVAAKDALETAQEYAGTTKDALLRGDGDAAMLAAGDADRYAEKAARLTTNVPWTVASAVPWLGSPFESTTQIADVVHGLTGEVLIPAAEAGSTLSPDSLLSDGGTVQLAPLREAAPVLASTSEAAQRWDERAQAIPEPSYLATIADARIQLQEQVTELTSLLYTTSLAADIAPGMLGLDGPRTYFLAFQTNAEARGTGGLVGGFGIVRAEDGTVKVDDLGSNVELPAADGRADYAAALAPAADLGPEFASQWGRSGALFDFRNSNLSSHFPYAAQIWRGMWANETGHVVDGAIATDPVALSYILEATGPIVMPDGQRVSADNVVELTQSELYARFADDNRGRKDYLQAIAGAVVAEMSGSISSPQKLLDALGRAAGEGRLAVWSANDQEQSVLASTPLGHAIPDDDAPYAAVVVNNHSGNKLDYYLSREIEYTAGSCDGDVRESRVRVRLTNDTPFVELTDYVAGQAQNQLGVAKGTNVSWLSLVATKGATLKSVTVDGRQALSLPGREVGHPMFDVIVPVPQGGSTDIEFVMEEPTAAGEARVPVQPLVDTPSVKVEVPTC
ncbi:MAG: DUF4012 domain-containing protein [Rhodococcus sp.]|nr:DUF4012 domain-containing protein [Rhodococcus sp. (in: high G+C Gram-positive bacteria)]